MVPEDGMQLKIRSTRGSIVISVRGKLDGSAAWQIKHALDRLLKYSRGARLQLDFQRVRHWEQFGVALLARGLKGLRAHFQGIRLIGMDEALAELFRRVGLERNAMAFI